MAAAHLQFDECKLQHRWHRRRCARLKRTGKVFQSDYQLKGYVHGDHSICRETVNVLYFIEFKGEYNSNTPKNSPSLQLYIKI